MKVQKFLVLGVSILWLGCGQARKSSGEKPVAKLLVEQKDLAAVLASGLDTDVEGEKDGRAIVYTHEPENVLAFSQSAKVESWNVAGDLQDLLNSYSAYAANIYNWDRVEAKLRSYAGGEITQLYQYGTSTRGHPLLALRVGKGGDGKHNLMITGATHGNEILTVDVVMAVMEHVIANYGKQDVITKALDNAYVYFVPVVSPDSYESKDRYVDGVDPNREYPWPEQVNRNPTKVIKAIMNLFNKQQITATLDYHSEAGVTMYPWAYTNNPMPQADLTLTRNTATAMANLSRTRVGQISKVIYVAKGSSADYYYWKSKALALAVELTNGTPDRSTGAQPMINTNLNSTLKFIELAAAANP